jgi:hypothetical protein
VIAPPTPGERRRDVAALVLLGLGAAALGYAFVGFRALAAYEETMDIPLRPGQEAWDIFLRYFLIGVAGLASVLAGLGTAVWSYLRRRRALSQP